MNPKPPKSFWEESPPTLPSKIVDYCKQTMPPHGSVGKESQAMQETQETQVQSLGQGDPLENVMATHSSFLAWRIPWTEEPGRGSMGSQESDMNEQLTHTHSF